MPARPRILTLTQAARLLKAHPDTVSEAIRERGLPAARLGRAYLFIEDDLIDWVRQQYSAPLQGSQAPQREKQACASIAEASAAPGGSTSPYRAASALSAALAPQTKPRRRNGPPRLTAISGGTSD